jgi:hypothetical protein
VQLAENPARARSLPIEIYDFVVETPGGFCSMPMNAAVTVRIGFRYSVYFQVA